MLGGDTVTMVGMVVLSLMLLRLMSDTLLLVTVSLVNVEFLPLTVSKQVSAIDIICLKFPSSLLLLLAFKEIWSMVLQRSGTGLDVPTGGDVFGSTSQVC